MSRILYDYREPETPTRKHFVERSAALLLSPIDTSFSYHSSSTTATSSSTASATNVWSSIDRKRKSDQNQGNALSATKEENETQPRIYYLRPSSKPVLPSPPLLSARSSAFLVALQQSIFAAIDVYLHRDSAISTDPSSDHHTNQAHGSLKPPTSSPNERQKHPLSRSRKVAAAVCCVLVITVMTTSAFFASKAYPRQPRNAQHLIMVGSTVVILLIALIMVAARRSLVEILAMAAVAFTLCQCLQNDLSNPS